MPRMGIGMPLSASITSAAVLTIDDPLFESFGGNDIAINYTRDRTNLVLYAQDTTQSQWVKTSTGIEGTLYEDPDGGTTGNAITGAASNSTKFIHQVQSVTAGETYTYSAYAKKGTLNFILLEVSDGTTTYSGNFNLNTGAVATTTRLVTSAIDDRSNGWYRCSITFQVLNTSEAGQIRAYGLYADNTPTVNIAVADTVLIYIWGQQLEADGEPTEYIVTTTSTATKNTTFIDRSKTWDFDTYDIMPEADPGSEGTWELTGGELVTNGGFGADSDWTLQSSWSISGGKASYDAVTSQHYLKQTLSSVAVGTTVKIQFDILDVEGSKNAYFKLECSGTPEAVFGYTTFSAGTHTYYHTITGGLDRLNFVPLNTSTGGYFSIDNVSVTEYAITPEAV